MTTPADSRSRRGFSAVLETAAVARPSVRTGAGRLGGAVLVVALGVGLGGAVRAQDPVIAYRVEEGNVGNQEFGGALGMDFDVVNPIAVTRLGVFDSGSDGLNLDITVELWERDNGGTPTDPADDFGVEPPLVTHTFTLAGPGELVGGSRFHTLAEPLDLEPGSYTIVAWGYGPGEPNGNGSTPARTVDDGGGALAFVGGGRWGTDVGFFPPNADGGPVNRYGAGTFEFAVRDTDQDGMPDFWEDLHGFDKEDPADAALDADSDDSKNVDEFVRGTDPREADTDGDGVRDGAESGSGAFVGPDDTGTDPLNGDSDFDGLGDGVENGDGLFVDPDRTGTSPVDADSDGDQFGDALEIALGSDPNDPDSTARETFGEAAYQSVPGTIGNQAHTGSLGLDFAVHAPITLTHLGVFDSGSDGLPEAATVEIWQRDDGGTPDDPTDDVPEFAPLADVTIAPGEGVLQGGDRFVRLAVPIDLEPGAYTVVAHPFGLNLDVNVGNPANDPADFGLSLSRSAALTFHGLGRWGAETDLGLFPPNNDGGPANRYGAGTFAFTTDDADGDGMPDFWEIDNDLDPNDPSDATEDPDNDGLQNREEYDVLTDPQNPDTDGDDLSDGAEIPVETDPRDPDTDADGLEDGDEVARGTDPLDVDSDDDGFSDGREVAAGSDPLDPDSRPVVTFEGELAYRIEAGTVGNQMFGGSLGMDFIVHSPIQVVELGVFDSGSDGLNRPIQVALWTRDDFDSPDIPEDDLAGERLVMLTFDAVDSGDLRDGSRMRPLAEPLVLLPGAYTIVANGYGAGEPNGNLGVANPPLSPDLLSVSDAPALTFVGGGRYNPAAGEFPLNVDTGPANRYAAGTFAFVEPEPVPFLITDVAFDATLREATLTWNSDPGAFYAVEYSADLVIWLEADDSIESGGEQTSYTQTDIPEGAALRFYRVRRQ